MELWTAQRAHSWKQEFKSLRDLGKYGNKKNMKRDAAGRPYATKSAVLYKKPRLTLAQTQEVKKEVNRQLVRKADKKLLYGRDSAATGVSTTGYAYAITTPLTRGDDGDNNFEGDSIKLLDLDVKMHWLAADDNNLIRFMIVQWHESAAITVQDVINIGAMPAALVPLASRNNSRMKQVTVLRDDLIQLQNLSNFTAGNGPIVCKRYHIKGSEMRPIFFSSTGTSLQKGQIYLITVTDSAALNHVSQDLAFEARFID